jgi:hypothetical protein
MECGKGSMAPLMGVGERGHKMPMRAGGKSMNEIERGKMLAKSRI